MHIGCAARPLLDAHGPDVEQGSLLGWWHALASPATQPRRSSDACQGFARVAALDEIVAKAAAASKADLKKIAADLEAAAKKLEGEADKANGGLYAKLAAKAADKVGARLWVRRVVQQAAFGAGHKLKGKAGSANRGLYAKLVANAAEVGPGLGRRLPCASAAVGTQQRPPCAFAHGLPTHRPVAPSLPPAARAPSGWPRSANAWTA